MVETLNCEITCKNNQCIEEKKVCDNEVNCFDKSDEICWSKKAISEKYFHGKFNSFFFL